MQKEKKGGENDEPKALLHAVRRVVFEDGETLPMLVYTSTGLPVFSVMNYVLGALRTQGQAANSIEQCCRVLAMLHHWLDRAGIDLLARCMVGKVLEDSEVDELENLFRLESKDFVDEVSQLYSNVTPRQGIQAKAAPPNVVSLEKFRKATAKRKARKEVAPQTHAIRLHHAQGYLKRIAFDYSIRATTTAESREAIKLEAERMGDKFKSLAPGIFVSAEQPALEGLDDVHVETIIKAIDPLATNNPWSDPFVRKRNQLMILVLLATGMRGGELLKMKTSDVHRGKAALSISRTPNDPEDPRTRKPQAKTRPRELALDETLYAALNDFVIKDRKAIPASQRKHPFVWTTEDGTPLSINALGKMFAVLRRKLPELPEDLTAHILRYTATDDLFERLGESDATEEQASEQLRYVMGWSPSSNMPAKYARRKIRAKANEALLGMQKSLFVKNSKNEGSRK